MQPVTAKPLYIRMHADDNVAIVANRGGLHAGAEFACGLRLVEQIPQGHKVALADIAEGEPFAATARSSAMPRRRSRAAAGSRNRWCRCRTRRRSTICRSRTAARSGCRRSKATPSKAIAMPTARSAPATSWRSRPRVQCVAGTIEFAVQAHPQRAAAEISRTSTTWWRSTHAYGCGVAIDAPDAVVPIRTLQNIAPQSRISAAR